MKPLKDSPEAWQAGDVALCIDADGWKCFKSNVLTDGPRYGQSHVVEAVSLRHAAQFLRFAQWGDDWFQASLFVKVQPRADEPAQIKEEVEA